VQSAVLQSRDARPSVRPSVCLSVRLWRCRLWSRSLEFFENVSCLVSKGCLLSADPNTTGLRQGEHPEIWTQSDPSPCWFERRRHSIANCGRMVTDSATVRLAISPQRVIRYTSCLFLCWVFRDGGSNGAISGSNKSKMAAATVFEKFQMATSPQPVVRCLCLFMFGSGWGFRGRQI